MEEALSHTGILQVFVSLQWLIFFSPPFNTCMGPTASFPLIRHTRSADASSVAACWECANKA